GDGGRRNRAVALSIGAGAVGLLLYAYLPLRAAHHPLVNWGSPTSLGRIFWVVSAKAFQKSVKEPQPGDEDVVGALVEALHPVGIAGLHVAAPPVRDGVGAWQRRPGRSQPVLGRGRGGRPLAAGSAAARLAGEQLFPDGVRPVVPAGCGGPAPGRGARAPALP